MRPGRASPAAGAGLYLDRVAANKPSCPNPGFAPRLPGWTIRCCGPGSGSPPGPWPPDHYALLGLVPASCDPTLVEGTVLDRMAQLRPHQLLHPDLVTEGMNRLAQALVCLTDPAARATLRRGAGLPAVRASAGSGEQEGTAPRSTVSTPAPLRTRARSPGPNPGRAAAEHNAGHRGSLFGRAARRPMCWFLPMRSSGMGRRD